MQQSPYYARAPLGQANTTTLATSTTPTSLVPQMTLWRVLGMTASAALAYHGYRRTGSIGWTLVWALGGGIVWPIGLAIAAAQGFAKPEGVRRNRGRRSRRSRR